MMQWLIIKPNVSNLLHKNLENIFSLYQTNIIITRQCGYLKSIKQNLFLFYYNRFQLKVFFLIKKKEDVFKCRRFNIHWR